MRVQRDCGVYALLNTRTGKIYVGSSVSMANRYSAHVSRLRQGIHTNSHLLSAWRQDADYFAVAALELCEPAEMRERERYWIAELQAADRDFGYNLDTVVSDHITISAETRAKMSETARNRSPERQANFLAAARSPSAETRAKMSEGQRGNTKMRGRTLSPEARAKISAAAQNRSPEHRAKLSATWKGKTRSAEDRAKMSAAHMGRTHSPETRAKITAANLARQARIRAERAQQAAAHQDEPPLD